MQEYIVIYNLLLYAKEKYNTLSYFIYMNMHINALLKHILLVLYKVEVYNYLNMLH